MRFVKLLTIPAVVLFGVLAAVPAFANGLSKATITVGCGANATAGQICVHLHGDNEVDAGLERLLYFDVYASSDLTKSLGEVVFDVKAPATEDAPFDETKCFPAIASGTSSVVKLVKVTDQNGKSSDFQFLAPGAPSPWIDFDNSHSQPVQVGEAGHCVASSPAQSPSPSPSVSTAVTLAQTGGFDYRWPILGLTLLVAGLALFMVSYARRGATTNTN